MKPRHLFVTKETDPVGSVIDVHRLWLPSEFPVFKTSYTESKLARLERWGREYKELAIAQDTFIRNLLCITYAKESVLKDTETTHPLIVRISHAFDFLIAQKNIGYVRITLDTTDKELSGITAVYQYPTGFRAHTLHIKKCLNFNETTLSNQSEPQN